MNAARIGAKQVGTFRVSASLPFHLSTFLLGKVFRLRRMLRTPQRAEDFSQ
jgi:hypothetical protein